MNILFSCDEYPPAKTGGIGTVTKTVAEGMALRGHNVYVVSGRLPGHGFPAIDIINGVTVYRITYFKSLGVLVHNKWTSTVLSKMGILAKLAENEIIRTHEFIERLVSEHKIDLVELPDYNILTKYYNTDRFIPFKPFSVKTLARVHGSKSFLSYYKTGKISPVGRRNDSDFFNKVDGISSVSRFSADFLHDKLGINRPVEVIYNPFNVSVLCRTSTKDGFAGQYIPYVLFSGKVIETKGAFSLIKAFGLFSEKHPEYKLLLAGNGDMETARQMLNDDIKDKVVFLGYVPHSELMNYIRASAFCVIPSYYENFSMAALEIMGMGKALIYTRETSGPEIITDGIDGMLADPRNLNEINEKMCFLAEHADIRVSMGEKAADKIAENFSEQAIMAELEDFYARMIDCK